MDNNEEITKVRLETDFFAEKRLLRALYNNPEYLEDNRVEESLFSSSSTKNIYRAIQNLKKRNIKISFLKIILNLLIMINHFLITKV